MENNSLNSQQETENASVSEKKPKKKNKILLITIITALLAGLGVGGFFTVRHFKNDSDGKDKEKAEQTENLIDITNYNADFSTEDEDEISDYDGPDESFYTQLGLALDENGEFQSLSGEFDASVSSSDDALDFISANADKIGITDVQSELDFVDERSSEGVTYYRFQQVLNDIPVQGNQLIVSVDSDGNIESLNGGFTPLSIDTTASVSIEMAEDLAKTTNGADSVISKSELIIIPHTDSGSAKLAYEIRTVGPENSGDYLIDAVSCDVISVSPLLQGISEVVNANVDGTIYQVELDRIAPDSLENVIPTYKMYDPTRQITVSDAGCETMVGFSTKYTTVNSITSLFSGNPFYTINLTPINADISQENDDGSKVFEVYPSNNLLDALTDIIATKASGGAKLNDILDNSPTNVFRGVELLEELLSGPKLPTYSFGSLSSIENAYDFYDNLGWKSIDGNGVPLQIVVGAKESLTSLSSGLSLKGFLEILGGFVPKINDIENAGFLNNSNTIIIGSMGGQPAVGKGTLGHEYTHAVINNMTTLDQSLPSATINEGYADVMGSLISNDWDFCLHEFPVTWDGYTQNVRSASSPNTYSNPAMKDSSDPYYHTSGVDEHENATIVSHSAYLMSQYGLSNDKIAKLFFNSMYMFTGTVGFEEDADMLLAASEALSFTKDEQQIVAQSLMETKMIDTSKEIKVHVVSGSSPISGAKISIDGKEVGKTDANGDFLLPLTSNLFGGFKISAEASGYESIKEHNVILKDSNSELTFNLKSEKEYYNGKTVTTKSSEKPDTKSGKTVTVTFMNMSDSNAKASKKKSDGQSYQVMAGYSIDLQALIDDMMKNDTLKKLGVANMYTDGIKIYCDTGFAGMEVELAYYVYGTDELFDFSKPIYEDVVIEPRTNIGGLGIGTGKDYSFKLGDDEYDLDFSGKDLEETAKELDRIFNHAGE